MSDRERYRVVVIVSTITLFGVLLRAVVAAKGGLWRDEALFLSIVRLPSWREMVDFLRFHESHPPLFYAVMRIWLAAVGDTDGAAIVLTVALSGLIVPVSYHIGRSLYSERVGLTTAGVAAISPALIDQSSVRPYALLALLVFASSYQLIMAVHTGRRKAWVLYTLFSSLMVYAHNWTWLVGLGQFVAVLTVVASDPKGRLGDGVKAFIAAGSVLALYSPWIPTLLDQAVNAGHAPILVGNAGSAFGLVGVFALMALQWTVLSPLSPNAYWAFTSGLGAMLMALAVRFGTASETPRPQSAEADPELSRQATRLFLIISLTAFGTAVLLTTRTLLVVRWCIAMLAPGLLLVATALALKTWDRSRAEKLRQTSAIVAAIVTLVVLNYAATLSEFFTRDRSNARELAAEISARVERDDLLIIAPGWLASSFNHYFDKPNRQINYPALAREPIVSFAGLTSRMGSPSALLSSKRAIEETYRRGGRVWLISDAFNIIPLSESDEIDLMTQPRRVGNVRVSQLNRSINALYGEPLLKIGPRANQAREEELVAVLWAPMHAAPDRKAKP